MARRRTGRDWQERAFEAAELSRRERDGAAVADLPGPHQESVDLPKRSSWRWTAWGLAAIIVAVAVRSALDSGGSPALKTSCTTPAFALSTTHTHRGGLIKWSATGPARSRFLLTIGVAALKPGANPGQLSPVPDPGVSVGNTQLAALAHALPSSCKASGAFNVGVAPATYTVRMFRLSGAGAAVSGAVVASKQLFVTG